MKLQIWDTVQIDLSRLARKLSSQLRDHIIEDLSESSLSTISPTDSPSTTSANGWTKPKLTPMTKSLPF